MPHHPDEVRYTREDLLQTLARVLGSTAEDPRIVYAYDQMISEWAQRAEDPEAESARYFKDGPVATVVDLVATRAWAAGRILS